MAHKPRSKKVKPLSNHATTHAANAPTQTPYVPAPTSNAPTRTLDVPTQSPDAPTRTHHTPTQTSHVPTNSSNPQPPQSDAVTFGVFIENAPLLDVLTFLGLTAVTSEGKNIRKLWDRAFKEGQAVGLEKGKLLGAKEWQDSSSEMMEDFFKAGAQKGQAMGIVAERQEWESKGHSDACRFPTSTFVDAALQTLPPVIPSTSTTSVQTHPPPDHGDLAIQTEPLANMPVDLPTTTNMSDWAEDTPTVTIPLFTPCHPRDLSALRSSTTNPFASLQSRARRTFGHHARRSRRSSSMQHHTSYHMPQSFTYKRPYTQQSAHTPHLGSNRGRSDGPPFAQLDWDRDPRLTDLSQALRALGWVHASVS